MLLIVACNIINNVVFFPLLPLRFFIVVRCVARMSLLFIIFLSLFNFYIFFVVSSRVSWKFLFFLWVVTTLACSLVGRILKVDNTAVES